MKKVSVSKVLMVLLEKSLDEAIRANSKKAIREVYVEYKNLGLIKTKAEIQYALEQCSEAIYEINARRAYRY